MTEVIEQRRWAVVIPNRCGELLICEPLMTRPRALAYGRGLYGRKVKVVRVVVSAEFRQG